MASLKEIRNRINSIGSTMQITNAMKMVSAAKLKRAQDSITALLPYAKKINELIQKITATLEGEINSPYNQTREVKKILLVAITSNKGLCGGFNSNVIKEIRSQVSASKNGEEVSIAAIGKKGRDALKKLYPMAYENVDIFNHLHFVDAEVIVEQLMKFYLEGSFDKIVLVYNHFINAAVQEIKYEQFLPIMPLEKEDNNSLDSRVDYIFEPNEREILETLIPKSLKIQFFKVLRDSFASEHGARMTAMHKATDNAKTIKSELTLSYNKARQAAITAEILEIVGGAEALKS